MGDDATVESWLLNAIETDSGFILARISPGRCYCRTAKSKRLDQGEPGFMPLSGVGRIWKLH